MGWTDPEARSQWKRWLSSDADRDHEGLDGQLRLWIPVIEEKHWDSQRSKAWELEEGGEVEKDFASKGDVKNALVNYLTTAASASTASEAKDDFLTGKDLQDTGSLTLELQGDNADQPPITTPVKAKAADPAQVKQEPAPLPTPEDLGPRD